MDKTINLSKLCLKKLSTIKSTDKYNKLIDCKNIYTKDINEKIKNDLIGDKCKNYLIKQGKNNKITKEDLYKNCESFKKIAEKKEKKGRKGRGGRQPRATQPKQPEPPKKPTEITNKDIEKLKDDLYKAIVGQDKDAIVKALENIKKTVCVEALQDTQKNILKPLITGVISGFKNPRNPYVGWKNDKNVLQADLYKPLDSIIQCAVAWGIGYGFKRTADYFTSSGSDLIRSGNPPSDDSGSGGGGGGGGAPASSNLEAQGQAQPIRREMSMPEYYQALLNQQTSKQYKQLATAQQIALAGDIAGSVERDKQTLEAMGLVRTPQGIMSKENWEQFKKAGEDLAENPSWGDLFSDLASSIPTALKAGVATAGGLLVPTMVVGRGTQPQAQPAQPAQPAPAQPAEQAPQQAPRQPPKSSQDLLDRAKEAIDRSKGLRAGLGLGLGSLAMMGRNQPKQSTMTAVAMAGLLAPNPTTEPVQLEGNPLEKEEMDLDLATAVEASMLGGREEDAGLKPQASYERLIENPRLRTIRGSRPISPNISPLTLQDRIQRGEYSPDITTPQRVNFPTPQQREMRESQEELDTRISDLQGGFQPPRPRPRTSQELTDISPPTLQAMEDAFGDLQAQRFDFLTARVKEQQPPQAEK